jgi:hypothetical protein
LYDDLFETTTGTQVRSIPRSLWQEKSGFKRLPNQEHEEEESLLQNEGDGK